MKSPYQTHDLHLPAWGPYTKLYSGISHIPAANDGVRFDLAVFPGLYRRRVDVPNVTFESGYHVWRAAPDLSCYTLRHELEWKDRVYADISFLQLDEDSDLRLIRAELCNDTGEPQNLVLHYMASAHDPQPSYRNFTLPGAEVHLPDPAAFVLARDYDDLRFAIPRPTDALGMDGMRRAEEAVPGFVKGYGVGMGFGGPGGTAFGGRVRLPNGKGDRVWYTFKLPVPLRTPCLCVRYVNEGPADACFTLSNGQTLTLPPSVQPVIARLSLDGPLPAGAVALTLTATGSAAAKLDCFVLCEQAAAGDFTVTLRGDGHRPQLAYRAGEGVMTLQYPHIRESYGVAWCAPDFQLRQIENDELDIFLRYTVHDHVSEVLHGNGKGHFTNIFIRPIPLAPGEHKVIWGSVVSAADPVAAAERCRTAMARRAEFDAAWERACIAMEAPPCLPAGEAYAFGQQLMCAVLATNVVYPVYTQGQYIRHNTPGRWWDSLYTWDSGFIGMGLAQLSVQRGYDCLNAYLTPPGSDEAAFIHHGSLVPTQFFLFAELLNRTGNRELAADCYPRLKQYYAFFTGQAIGSTTATLASGLLRPWDYFYNSGGWDDYPAQKALHARRLEADCTPVVTTAMGIRCAKILAYVAALLGEEADAARFSADAERLTAALAPAWDEEAGYFGYVLHDETGRPSGLMRTGEGVNYNMGLDGAEPLVAGACTEAQAAALWQKLETPGRLWCDCGLSTVDQTAPYYSSSGYWNGAVWMPHQWLFFKAALDAGRAEFAWRIARTALALWQDECARSYHCFEHFMIESRRGAGWHQFGGLSAPVVQWFASYFVPGTLTTGFDTFVRTARFAPNFTGVQATLFCTRPGPCIVLAALRPGAVQLHCSAPAYINLRHDGLWEITLHPTAVGPVELALG